jgi:ATP-dependent Zn protease
MSNYWSSILTSVAPFALLLALWFFILRRMQAGKQRAAENPFGPPQQMSTSEIVAELRSLRQSVDALRKEIADRK